MNLANPPSRVCVTGMSGFGKTTFWVRYLEGHGARVKFVFDHEGEAALRYRVRPATNPQELAEAVESGWVIYDPAAMWGGDTEAGFRFFCAFSLAVAKKNAHLGQVEGPFCL